ncbi:universal stress protein [Nocardia miyunensis]|uniref:universal stress protein n=1 Tax=Nocardia miyunensis TaxID=282684 RepID=UPI000A0785A5|nr:universal stress protein [Nocardia miyunensis]
MAGIFGKRTRPVRSEDDAHILASARVIVGVDGSPGSDMALRWAARFADAHRRELCIVHGMNLTGTTWPGGAYSVGSISVVDAARAHGEQAIMRAERVAHAIAPEVPVSTEVVTDNAAALLIDHSTGAFAVVIGATGSAGTLAHLGSTLLSVVAHAHGPVVVVRADPKAGGTVHSSGPVVVGIDGGPTSDAAIAAAFAEAARRDVELVAVHVFNDQNFGHYAGYDTLRLADGNPGEAENAIVAERIAGWQEKFPEVRVARNSYAFAPGEHLLKWSESAQLVVVGSRGRGGFTGMLFGSTANTLVQHASCPVMVVHP